MADVCKKHRTNPAKGYHACPGCEVDQLRAKVADLEALITAENQRKQQLEQEVERLESAIKRTLDENGGESATNKGQQT